MKYLLFAPDGKQFLVESGKGKFSTHLGAIDLGKLKPGKIKTNMGKIFSVVEATFIDLLLNSKRGPAVVLPKDAAAIISHGGLRCGDTVVDIGTGSGWLSSMLANAVGPTGKVTTYEIRKEFAKLAERNFKFMGLSNVKVKLQNPIQKLNDKKVDLITVDLAEPHLILPNAQKALKSGKFLVAYCPQMTQVQEFISHLGRYSFKLEKTLEIQEREWNIHDKVCRPQHNALTHTAFLVFVRKL